MPSYTRVIFIPVFSLDLLLCVFAASERRPCSFVYDRAVFAPTASGLRPHLKSVVRFGPERRQHYMLIGSVSVADVRLVAARIKLHLYGTFLQTKLRLCFDHKSSSIHVGCASIYIR